DEERERIEVVVPDQQLSLAIGRRGQNVRLASQLTGWDIDILTEQEESERRQAEFENRTRMFMDALNVDEVVGQLLASEGFTSVEELAFVEDKEIASIEGFDADTAQELQTRARDYLARIEAEFDAKRREIGGEDGVNEMTGVTSEVRVSLCEGGSRRSLMLWGEEGGRGVGGGGRERVWGEGATGGGARPPAPPPAQRAGSPRGGPAGQ